MKITSLKKTHSKIFAAHNRRTRYQGQVYLIRCQTLGPLVLADAEPIPQGGTPISLFAKTPVAKGLRGLVEAGVFS